MRMPVERSSGSDPRIVGGASMMLSRVDAFRWFSYLRQDEAGRAAVVCRAWAVAFMHLTIRDKHGTAWSPSSMQCATLCVRQHPGLGRLPRIIGSCDVIARCSVVSPFKYEPARGAQRSAESGVFRCITLAQVLGWQAQPFV